MSGLGALLPGTASLTADTEQDADVEWTEAWVGRTAEVRQLREQLAARPRVLPAELTHVVFEEPAEDGVRAVPARLLHRDAGIDRRSFVVDAGRTRGIYRGLAAVHGHSLVGVVQVVGRGACRVLRVDDPARDNVFPALIVPQREFEQALSGAPIAPVMPPPEDEPPQRAGGVCRGVGDGTLVVGHLAEGDARPGDIAVTGAGRLGVPSALVLGRVTRVHDDDRDGVYEAIVEPLRDLDTLASVIIYVRPPLERALRPEAK